MGIEDYIKLLVQFPLALVLLYFIHKILSLYSETLTKTIELLKDMIEKQHKEDK